MADEKILTDILDRLGRLERDAVRLRAGQVTDRSTLSVQLGSATEGGGDDAGSYTNIRAIGHMNDDDKVAVLRAGNDLLVLGKLGSGINYGSIGITGIGATEHTVVVNHGLGETPTVVLALCSSAALNLGYETFTPTTFTIRARHIDGTIWSSTHGIRWVALA